MIYPESRFRLSLVLLFSFFSFCSCIDWLGVHYIVFSCLFSFFYLSPTPLSSYLTALWFFKPGLFTFSLFAFVCSFLVTIFDLAGLCLFLLCLLSIYLVSLHLWLESGNFLSSTLLITWIWVSILILLAPACSLSRIALNGCVFSRHRKILALCVCFSFVMFRFISCYSLGSLSML